MCGCTSQQGTDLLLAQSIADATYGFNTYCSRTEFFSQSRNLDINTPGGTGGKPLIVKDNSGTSLFQCETAWIQKGPTAELNREAGSREWIFRTDNLNANHGGN